MISFLSGGVSMWYGVGIFASVVAVMILAAARFRAGRQDNRILVGEQDDVLSFPPKSMGRDG